MFSSRRKQPASGTASTSATADAAMRGTRLENIGRCDTDRRIRNRSNPVNCAIAARTRRAECEKGYQPPAGRPIEITAAAAILWRRCGYVTRRRNPRRLRRRNVGSISSVKPVTWRHTAAHSDLFFRLVDDVEQTGDVRRRLRRGDELVVERI